MPGGDKGRGWSCAAASQEMPTIAGKLQEAMKRHRRISLEMSEGGRPCQHLDCRRQSPELGDNKFLLFEATPLVVFRYGSPRELTDESMALANIH